MDFDHSHRWKCVSAREVDKPITMVYTRESKKIKEGEMNVGGVDWWGEKVEEKMEESENKDESKFGGKGGEGMSEKEASEGAGDSKVDAGGEEATEEEKDSKGKDESKPGVGVGIPLDDARPGVIPPWSVGNTGSSPRKTLAHYAQIFDEWEKRPGIPGRRPPPKRKFPGHGERVVEPPLYSVQLEELNRQADLQKWRDILREREAEAGPSGGRQQELDRQANLQKWKDIIRYTLARRSDSSDSDSE